MITIPHLILDWMRTPPEAEAEPLTPESFFQNVDLRAWYFQIEQTGAWDDALRLVVQHLEEVSSTRKKVLFALFCGALVERSACAEPAFAHCLELMREAIDILHPYCSEVWHEKLSECQGDDQHAELDAHDLRHWEQDNNLHPYCSETWHEKSSECQGDDQHAELDAHDLSIKRHWEQVQQALSELDQSQRQALKVRAEDVDILVRPIMTMFMRSASNRAYYGAQAELLHLIETIHLNDTLPFKALYFLHEASQLGYIDALHVVLPAERRGILVKVHGVNNGFHLIGLLEEMLQRCVSSTSRNWWQKLLALKSPPDSSKVVLEPTQHRSSHHWVMAGAYEQGQLVRPMHMLWGEMPLRNLPRKSGQTVVYALPPEKGPRRSWSGFYKSLHDAQRPCVRWLRDLTADEVRLFLQ